MVDLTIKKEMIEILSSMKGKILKSLEGQYRPSFKLFDEFVRFNLGKFAVEVFSYETGVLWYWNADYLVKDEASVFTVYKKDPSKRKYQEGWEPVKLLKDEKISEVILVRDLIKNNHGDEILVDSGFVVKTDEKVYTFSKCCLESFEIHMSESDKIDMYYSLKRVREDCSEEESNLKATVKRDYIFL